jgi:Complex I intermediate-associated protein 30 (CIA30)
VLDNNGIANVIAFSHCILPTQIIHSLKNGDCLRQFSSYRATFSIPLGEWRTVRLPWSKFQGKGPGAEGKALDATTLRRIGVVAIGREMDVSIGVGGVKFYSVL